MTRFSISCGLILAALTLLAAGTPAHAGERPFKAWGEGFVNNYSGTLYGGGEATHLGHSRLFLNYDPDLVQYGIFLPYSMFLTSANGDRLYFDFDAEYNSFDPATGVVSATVTFTGGTGRFQDATGRADVMFVYLPYFYEYHNPNNFSFLIDGSIDF